MMPLPSTAVRRILALAVIVLAGCGGGDDSGVPDFSDCSTWTTGAVSTDEWGNGCFDPASNTIHGSGFYECDDGRVLRWNDALWGYEGETAQTYPPDAEQVPPQSERDSCNP